MKILLFIINVIYPWMKRLSHILWISTGFHQSSSTELTSPNSETDLSICFNHLKEDRHCNKASTTGSVHQLQLDSSHGFLSFLAFLQTGKISSNSTSHKALLFENLAGVWTSFPSLNSIEGLEDLQRQLGFHFGRRGRAGLQELRKDQVVIKVDSGGKLFATLAFPPLEKNYQGLNAKELSHDQHMYCTGNPNDPLASLEFYLAKLHPN